MLHRLTLTAFVSLFLLAGAAQADLVGGPDIIVAPASVVDDLPGAENDHQQAFEERHNVKLPVNVFVDGGFIAAGTYVNSHMIFLNTPGSAVTSDTQDWTFANPILGVMSDRDGALEAASNNLLGAPGTTYPAAFDNRGFEGNFDAYVISPDSLSMKVRMRVTEPGDWIRVITATVPEPASAVLLVLGAAAVLARRRRRRRTS